MPRTTPSTLTPAELRAWLDRHDLNTYTGGPALGISRRQLMRLLAGTQAVPQPIALRILDSK